MITTEKEERIVSIHSKMVGKHVWVMPENCVGKIHSLDGTESFKVMCRENVTIKQLLCGLNKGASIEALKLLCTNPETKEIYQSPVFQKLSGVETLRDGIMVGDDPGYVRDVKLSQICDMLRGHRGK